MDVQTLLTALEQQNFYLADAVETMRRIADILDQITPPTLIAPNYTLPLERWNDFEWSSIGATVERADVYGAAVVSWRGQVFVRRSPANKFDPAVWFSRCTGKDAQGENQYERLCTFKPTPQAEPLPERVARLVR